MIPKIIHYCWFGGQEMPKNEASYVEGWKKLLPDYHFMLWNENNFDINTVKFTQQVASVKKWGFVNDYIKAFAIYNYGGIHLDTDVEIIKPFDDLLEKNICFSGFEDKTWIAPGLIFAGEKGCLVAKEIMRYYSNYNFINKDGSLNMIPSPQILSKILLKYGLKQNNTYQELGIFTAYPTEYFCPKSFITGQIVNTENTYSIHHYSASWVSEEGKTGIKDRWHFFEKYGEDKYLVNLYEKAKLYNINRDVYKMPLKELYKVTIKRTLKFLLKHK